MAFMTQQQTNVGMFVPVTKIWEGQQRISQIDVNSPEFKQLLISLYQNIGIIALALNAKDTGIYMTSEFVTSQQFFNPTDPNPLAMRGGFRMVVNFGALPNTGTKSVAHNIPIIATGLPYVFTHIYACATDQVGHNYIPIPYASPTDANEIELKVDATNVTIITGSDRTAFTICYVILEYLQS
jgi:hypothetical protein